MLNFNILLLLRPPDAYVIDICHRGGKFVYPGRDRGDDIEHKISRMADEHGLPVPDSDIGGTGSSTRHRQCTGRQRLLFLY